MVEALKGIEKVSQRLDTINELLALGEIIRLGENVLLSRDAELTTIFDTEECLIGVGRYKKKGDATPGHRHEGLTQYLLQYKGKCAVDFGDGGHRVIDVGDCVKLLPGEFHKVTALGDNVEQVFICIPAEKGYKINKEQLLSEQAGGGKP